MDKNELINFYETQQPYNSKTANRQKIWFYTCSITTLLCSLTTIPFVSVQTIPTWISILTATVTALSQGINSIFKFHEQWISYRSTSENLKSEYFKYINEIDEYENLSEREKIFAKNVNKIVTQNNLTWKDLQRQETKSNVSKQKQC